jgi:hypothetical protein
LFPSAFIALSDSNEIGSCWPVDVVVDGTVVFAMVGAAEVGAADVAVTTGGTAVPGPSVITVPTGVVLGIAEVETGVLAATAGCEEACRLVDPHPAAKRTARAAAVAIETKVIERTVAVSGRGGEVATGRAPPRPRSSCPFPSADWFMGRQGLGEEPEGEAGARGGRIAGEDAVMLLDDATSDGEAEAVSGFVGIESDEALEDVFALFVWDAGAVVDHACLHVPVVSL